MVRYSGKTHRRIPWLASDRGAFRPHVVDVRLPAIHRKQAGSSSRRGLRHEELHDQSRTQSNPECLEHHREPSPGSKNSAGRKTGTGASRRHSGPSAPGSAASFFARVRREVEARVPSRQQAAPAPRAIRVSGCRSGSTMLTPSTGTVKIRVSRSRCPRRTSRGVFARCTSAIPTVMFSGSASRCTSIRAERRRTASLSDSRQRRSLPRRHPRRRRRTPREAANAYSVTSTVVLSVPAHRHPRRKRPSHHLDIFLIFKYDPYARR